MAVGEPLRAHDRLVRASEVMHLDVVNREGQELGEVEDLMVVRDHVAFALLATGGLPESEVRLTPVPWRMLAWRADRHVLVADTSPHRMMAAPHFYRERGPEVGEREWQEEVLRYYGYAEEEVTAAGHASRLEGTGLSETPTGTRAVGREPAVPTGPHEFEELPESGATAEEEEGRTAEADALMPGGPGEERRALSEEEGFRPESEEEPLGAGEKPGPVTADEQDDIDRFKRRRRAA